MTLYKTKQMQLMTLLTNICALNKWKYLKKNNSIQITFSQEIAQQLGLPETVTIKLSKQQTTLESRMIIQKIMQFLTLTQSNLFRGTIHSSIIPKNISNQLKDITSPILWFIWWKITLQALSLKDYFLCTVFVCSPSVKHLGCFSEGTFFDTIMSNVVEKAIALPLSEEDMNNIFHLHQQSAANYLEDTLRHDLKQQHAELLKQKQKIEDFYYYTAMQKKQRPLQSKKQQGEIEQLFHEKDDLLQNIENRLMSEQMHLIPQDQYHLLLQVI